MRREERPIFPIIRPGKFAVLSGIWTILYQHSNKVNPESKDFCNIFK